MTFQVRSPRHDEVLAFFTAPKGYVAAFEDGRPVAMAGLTMLGDRVYATFDVVRGVKNRWAVARAVRRYLHDHNETVYVQADVDGHPTAERFLKWLGFEPTDETMRDLRIWVWKRWEI